MEIFFSLFACLFWHVLLIGFGVWLGSVKPWRKKLVLVDRVGPSPTARQGRQVQQLYYDDGEEYAG